MEQICHDRITTFVGTEPSLTNNLIHLSSRSPVTNFLQTAWLFLARARQASSLRCWFAVTETQVGQGRRPTFEAVGSSHWVEGVVWENKPWAADCCREGAGGIQPRYAALKRKKILSSRHAKHTHTPVFLFSLVLPSNLSPSQSQCDCESQEQVQPPTQLATVQVT